MSKKEITYDSRLSIWMRTASTEEKEQAWEEIMRGVARDQQVIMDKAYIKRSQRDAHACSSNKG